MKKILIYLVFLSLIGCATVKDKFCDYDTIVPENKMAIDSRVLTGCKDLVVPPTPLTYEGILANTKENTAIYIDCKNKMKAAIVIIEKFSNN